MARRVARFSASLLVLLALVFPTAAAATEVAGFDGATAAGAAPTRDGTGRVVGIVASPSGGYWQFTPAGGVFSWGGAAFHGSTGGMRLNKPVVGMAATPTGRGYWLVASDGGIFSFGDAVFRGSTGAIKLNRPIVGMASSPSGAGYWLVADDGGIFNFGDAAFHGSAGGQRLPEPVVGMAVPNGGGGYLLATMDGRVLAFGGATAGGSLAAACKSEEVVGITARPGGGFLLTTGGFRSAAIPAGTHPIEVVALESANMERLLRFRQGCQPDTATRGGYLGHPLPGAGETSSYGNRIHPIYGRPQFHAGIDLAGAGTAILAAEDGVVVSIERRQGYGLTTVLDHGDGVGTVYAHQSAVGVRVGDRVSRGQRIGTVGRTGYATGDHLHYEVRRHGTPTEPKAWW